MRVGIDLMGSETPPQELYQAVIKAADHFDASYTFIVLATQSIVNELSSIPHSSQHSLNAARIEYHLVHEIITMGDEPLSAIRHKKGSSLVTGIRLLKKKQIHAFISTGNTGALIAAASLSLPMLPGINRPALLAELPTKKGPMVVVDVGGNVSYKAHHLVQFAFMGAAYQRCMNGHSLPKVGLLNIGVESKKGTVEHRLAYQLLENQKKSAFLTFIGNVEGRALFQGKVDVLVTDGFTGNVLLKSIEGVSLFILDSIQSLCKDQDPGSFTYIHKELRKQFHHEEYRGAIVAGIDGVVVKCHGNSSPLALFNGIKGAITLVQKKFLQGITESLADVQASNDPAAFVDQESKSI